MNKEPKRPCSECMHLDVRENEYPCNVCNRYWPRRHTEGATDMWEPNIVVDAVDVVNSPRHYKQFPIEVIQLTRHLNFNRGNAVKYLSRAGQKDPAREIEDLKKARWYVDDEIQRLTGDGSHSRP
jgi:hypothetical protein